MAEPLGQQSVVCDAFELALKRKDAAGLLAVLASPKVCLFLQCATVNDGPFMVEQVSSRAGDRRSEQSSSAPFDLKEAHWLIYVNRLQLKSSYG